MNYRTILREIASLPGDLKYLVDCLEADHRDDTPFRDVGRLIIVSAGDGAIAGGCVQDWFHSIGLESLVIQPQDFLHGQGSFGREATLVVLLSASGKTPDLLEAAKECADNDLRHLAITADPSSPLAISCKSHISHALKDKERCPGIRTFQMFLVTLFWLGSSCRRIPWHDQKEELLHLAAMMAEEVELAPREMERSLAEQAAGSRNMNLIGSGQFYWLAKFVSAKFYETCGIPSYVLSIDEWLHFGRLNGLGSPTLILFAYGGQFSQGAGKVKRIAAKLNIDCIDFYGSLESMAAGDHGDSGIRVRFFPPYLVIRSLFMIAKTMEILDCVSFSSNPASTGTAENL